MLGARNMGDGPNPAEDIVERPKPCAFCGHDLERRGAYFRHPANDCILRNFDIYVAQVEAWNVRKEVNSILTDIGVMMSEFVDNWPNPKKVRTALALIAKTLRAALNASTLVDENAMLREELEHFVDIVDGTENTGFDPHVEQMLMDAAESARTALSHKETNR